MSEDRIAQTDYKEITLTEVIMHTLYTVSMY